MRAVVRPGMDKAPGGEDPPGTILGNQDVSFYSFFRIFLPRRRLNPEAIYRN
jgi:hypothetical protein